MQKYIVRGAVIVVTTVIAILVVLAISGSLERIDEWQATYPSLQVVAGILGVVASIAIVTLWVAMVYHWGVSQFPSNAERFLWCSLLTLFNVVGAIVYYFVVYERRQSKKPSP